MRPSRAALWTRRWSTSLVASAATTSRWLAPTWTSSGASCSTTRVRATCSAPVRPRGPTPMCRWRASCRGTPTRAYGWCRRASTGLSSCATRGAAESGRASGPTARPRGRRGSRPGSAGPTRTTGSSGCASATFVANSPRFTCASCRRPSGSAPRSRANGAAPPPADAPTSTPSGTTRSGSWSSAPSRRRACSASLRPTRAASTSTATACWTSPSPSGWPSSSRRAAGCASCMRPTGASAPRPSATCARCLWT
mmetsp:Transcript_29388/g.94821  ORF Transcript_29388/g.94821 Transcript_29388/m.94821 type:complete len:253 (+) Transcript_29388:557-1315(+)